jgi:hypothetical protein
MPPLRHTLVSDGPTDANLIPIINWTLREAADVPVAEGVRADLQRLPRPPVNFVERIKSAVDLFPCDVLFIHREAEGEQPEKRYAEIRDAVNQATKDGCKVPAVAVVPVRMMEAWLIFDEHAIRNAAGNPNGNVPLNLPTLNKVEARPDPKSDLRAALISASGLNGRRRKKFRDSQALWRIVDFIQDFSPLRQLSAFRVFEEIIRVLKANAWKAGFYGL